MRVIFHLSPRTHIDASHFKKLNWLPVEKRVLQLKLTMVYKILHGHCPNYFKNYFQSMRDFHGVNTRASIADLRLPDLTLEVGRSSFLYTGGDEWNKIPLNVRQAKTLSGFKNTLKKFLMSEVT